MSCSVWAMPMFSPWREDGKPGKNQAAKSIPISPQAPSFHSWKCKTSGHENKLGVPLKRGTPNQKSNCELLAFLKLEAHCELDLSFAEESRASFRDALERRVKGEGIIREVLGLER